MRRTRLRVVLWGDGESPHLLKWARALAPRVELHVASSRGLAPALAELVAPERTLALGHATRFAGGNAALLSGATRMSEPQADAASRARTPALRASHASVPCELR